VERMESRVRKDHKDTRERLEDVEFEDHKVILEFQGQEDSKDQKDTWEREDGLENVD